MSIVIYGHEILFLKGKRLCQLPPRSQCIQPRTMDSIPREEDEEWKKIGWKRIRISCRDIDNVLNPPNIKEWLSEEKLLRF